MHVDGEDCEIGAGAKLARGLADEAEAGKAWEMAAKRGPAKFSRSEISGGWKQSGRKRRRCGEGCGVDECACVLDKWGNGLNELAESDKWGELAKGMIWPK